MKRSTAWCAVTPPILSAIHMSSAFAQSCPVCPGTLPNYETTYSVPGPDQFTRFKQELAYVFGSTTIYFNARRVMEEDGTGATPFDTCYFAGSAVPEQLLLSGGDWIVGGYDAFQTNYWGYDNLGWSSSTQPQPIPYYRLYRPQNNLPMPCESRAVQAMLMLCDADGTWYDYTDRNLLDRWINMTSVTNCRTDISSSACSTQPYP
jgi:hypothetical protein